MDIAACRSFLAVFDTGTATAAAARRFVSQPALSRQIQALEAQCRTRLFTRSKTGMQPTQAARQLEPVFRRLVTEMQTAELAVSALGEQRVPLTIVCPTMVAEGLLLPFVAQTRTRVTNVIERPTTEIFEVLSRRQADLALAPLLPPPEFASALVYRIPFTLQVPETSRLAEHESIDIRELSGMPVIVPDRSNGTRIALDDHLAHAGVRFRPLLEVSRAHIGQAMVKAGKGVVITVDPAKYDLVALPLHDGDTALTLDEWAAWPADHYAIESIADFLDAYVRWMREQPGFERLDYTAASAFIQLP